MKFKIILSIAILTICSQAIDNNITKGLFLDAPMQKKQLTAKLGSAISMVKRFRYIDINTTLLPQYISSSTSVSTQATASIPNPTVQEVLIPLNLFDGTQYIAKITKVRKSTATATTIWSGKIVGMKHSHVSLASTNGILAGSIRTEDGTFFKIVYSGNGTHMIQEINELNLPQEREPLTVPTSASTVISSGSTVPTASIDTGDVIDIMVVYTAAARVSAGGQAAIESIINSSVSTMNTTFNNSNIATQVRLVHTAEVVYNRGETGISSGFNTALDDLTNPADGYMDEIHTLRDTYHADMVQLLFNNNSSGGLAWVMTDTTSPFDAYAFSVVHYNYADGWAFDHEFGHNMGMVHDRLNSSSEGSYSYSYGYQSPTSAWHSVMSYACTGGCPRIDYWSNPAVTYSGESTGSTIGAADEADAHATITTNLSIIANWRVSPAPTPDLIVSSITTANTNLTTGQNISVDASVLNQGDAIADATTLRYFLSTDSIISTGDTELANTSVASLAVSGSSLHTANITAPLSAGTYFLGVCVDSVNTELATANNCSNALQVVVELDTDGDGIADIVDTDDDNDGISDSDEIANGLNPLDASDGQADFDGDGFSNSVEIAAGTDIRNASSKPTWTPIFTGDGLLIIVPVAP